MTAVGEAGSAVEPSSPAGALDPLAQAPLREVRLAVVMYGGVSLCIYMNGVAQELLHLVRATAPRSLEDPSLPAASALRSTEQVYRRLSQLIGPGNHLTPGDLQDTVGIDRHPALARFVIDVISGSSAGGINGIFLSKALSNDQDLTSLGELWIEEGDIGLLLNDKESVKGLRPTIDLRKPPGSLLNGDRMYLKLLDAFTKMELDRPTDEQRESRLAGELDLWVTTTDLAGLLLPIRIANRTTWERRYRNVFHFRYSREDVTGEHQNDFHALNNPFLAFAARCTSAFPWAFEPADLVTISRPMTSFDAYRALGVPPEGGSDWTDRWKRFFPDYVVDPLTGRGPDARSTPFPKRDFGDGGALDNKPFTYATAALLRKQADLPVDRKLLFVEPDPGQPERGEDSGKPDALGNFLLQAVLLPRQETVRDDLQAVSDRNGLIERVDRLLESLDEDAYAAARQTPSDRSIVRKSPTVADRDLGDEAGRPRYLGYHRLRVAATTEDLASLVARALDLPEEPEYVGAIRYLVEAWRLSRYVEYPPEEPERSLEAEDRDVPRSTNRFLADFDLRYRLRRLALLDRRIDRLARLDEGARRMLAAAGFPWPATSEEQAEFLDALISVKRGLASAKRTLREAGRTLRRRPSSILSEGRIRRGLATLNESPSPSISDLVHRTGVSLDVLRSILDGPTEDERLDRAGRFFNEHRPAFLALDATLADRLRAVIEEAAGEVAEALETPVSEQDPAGIARRYLIHSYNRFEDYDSVAFPLLYASGAGEADVVEVIRVSPLDATSLVDPNPPGTPPKVTGARYMHFGAFLSRLWRERDILWGRLDAAEILIGALLPLDLGDPERRAELANELLTQAQRVIVREQLGTRDRAELVSLLAQVLASVPAGTTPSEADLRRILVHAAGPPLDERMLMVLEAVIQDEGLLVEHVRRSAGEIEPLPPNETLRTIGRGAHIMGEVLAGVAEGRGQKRLGLPFVWVGRLGALLTGMVEVATPRSFLHLIGRHWFALLVLFEALAIAGGAVLSAPGVVQFGVTALVATLVFAIAVWTLRRFFDRGQGWWAVAAAVLALLLIAVLALAVAELIHLGHTYPWLPVVGRASPSASAS